MSENSYGITAKFVEMGRDCVLLVGGGTVHIGAAATGYMDESGEIRAELTSLPGHKEGPLALRYALQAAAKLQRTVTVIMGIHVDEATREMILDMVRISDELVEREIEAYVSCMAKQDQ